MTNVLKLRTKVLKVRQIFLNLQEILLNFEEIVLKVRQIFLSTYSFLETSVQVAPERTAGPWTLISGKLHEATRQPSTHQPNTRNC